MNRRLRRIIDIPSTDPDEQRRARLLNILLLLTGGIAFVAIFAAILFPNVVLDGELVVASSAAVLASVTLCYWLNRQGFSTVASIIFSVVVATALALGDTPEEVVDGRSLFLLTVPILMASLLIRSYGSFLMAGYMTLLVAIIGQRVNLPINLIAIFGFLVIATISWLFASSLERALVELRRINQNLDQRVRERTAALEATNRRLQQEIKERERSEAAHRR